MTLDAQLREELAVAMATLKELESRRPVEHRTNPNCAMSRAYHQCKAALTAAIAAAEDIR